MVSNTLVSFFEDTSFEGRQPEKCSKSKDVTNLYVAIPLYWTACGYFLLVLRKEILSKKLYQQHFK